MEESEKIFKEQFERIPKMLQQHILSNALNINIEEILSPHPLQAVQKKAFKTEIILVLLQLAPVDQFTNNIKQNMEIAMNRAEGIAKKTKQLIFAPVQDHLIDRSGKIESVEEKSKIDGVVPVKKSQVEMPRKEINNEIPLVEIGKKKEEKKEPDHPIVAPTPEEVVPTAKEKVLQKPATPEGESVDIFKQRLEEPVYAPVKKDQVGESNRPVANANPSSEDAIAKDPYKETIGDE